MLQITFENSDKEVLQALFKEFRNKYSGKIARALDKGLDNFREWARPKFFQNSKLGLLAASPRMRGEFGVPNFAAQLDLAVMKFLDLLHLDIRWNTSQMFLSVGVILYKTEIESIANDFVLYTRKGEINWLDWLFQGDSAVVGNYYYKVDEKSALSSRTGTGYMRKSVKEQPWKVPKLFQGTVEDNIFTKKLDDLAADIGRFLEVALTEI